MPDERDLSAGILDEAKAIAELSISSEWVGMLAVVGGRASAKHTVGIECPDATIAEALHRT